MKRSKLAMLNFMALCCVLGLFTKKLVNPMANVITEALHIPGGISTGFSIMFLVVALEVTGMRGGGSLMGCVQGLLALALGRVGSMGIFMPIGYLIPGITIDLVCGLMKKGRFCRQERMVLTNVLAAVMASVTANVLVFELKGTVLWLYLCVSAASGSIYGLLGSWIAGRLHKAFIWNLDEPGGKRS
ncbi:hypothetical protein [Qiania dongpingensis]|uniref:Energy-coupling factor transport system substrate-specific component n=1 Tax=Qiania dongpingensis TaxID=2763669 RepID=A0A7G9G3N5_9FIRM|nr:hypothetical protein [Qiania dongpingensis]QNM05417.1 hypothetical protein H9Q78_13445 [Qiania dongpingensis]